MTKMREALELALKRIHSDVCGRTCCTECAAVRGALEADPLDYESVGPDIADRLECFFDKAPKVLEWGAKDQAAYESGWNAAVADIIVNWSKP